MTAPQVFAIFVGALAVTMGTGWAVFARRFADRASEGPEWLWIQHSRRTNVVVARAAGGLLIVLGCAVGGLALGGVLV